MKYKELTEKIIGCSYRIYNEMGFGFLESVYEKCLTIELKKTGLLFKTQQPITAHYHNEPVGEFIADIIIETKIIVELKSVRRIISKHEQQLVNYLTATGLDVGLIINFAEQRIEVKRKVRELASFKKNPVYPVNPVKTDD